MIPNSHEFFRDLLEGGQSVYSAKQAKFIQRAEEFAKLHVQAALKAAANGVCIDWDHIDMLEGDSERIINKESILAAYPLDNIK